MRRGVMADLPFPTGCASCGAPGWPWCGPCEEQVVVLADPPGCARCGRPALEPVGSCRECPPPEIASLRAPFLFDGPVRHALLKLKFAGLRGVAAPMGAAMAAAWDRERLPVTWVPLSSARLATRGYDQAGAIAASAAERLGVRPVRLLRRIRDTPPQAKANRAERQASLRDAFRAVGRVPDEVILVDDVVTTGSTTAECAAVLQAAGARQVHVLAAARTLSGSLPARVYARPTASSGSVVARR